MKRGLEGKRDKNKMTNLPRDPDEQRKMEVRDEETKQEHNTEENYWRQKWVC